MLSNQHAEAIMAIQSHLRTLTPTQPMVKWLMSKEDEEFVTSTFYFWSNDENRCSTLVNCLVPILHKVCQFQGCTYCNLEKKFDKSKKIFSSSK